MPRLILFLLVASVPLAAWAQTATLTGRVTTQRDAPLEGVSVFVPGTLAATFTDADGAYHLDDVPAGEALDVHAAFAGYRTATVQVTLRDGETATHNFVLRTQPFWERALLFSTDPDAGAAEATFALPRTLEAAGLPARTVDEASGLLPGVIRDERSDTLTFLHGTRVARSLDGVPLPAPLPLPWDAVAGLTFYGEHTPTRFAGGRDATLDVTTRDGAEGRLLRVAVVGSPVSPTRLGEVRLAAGAPLLGDRFRFFAATSLARQADPYPAAVGVARLRPDARARLAESPQDLVVYRNGNPDDRRYLPLPVGLPPALSLDALPGYLDIPEGYALVPERGLFRHATDGLTATDFTFDRPRVPADAEARRLFVRTGLSLGRLEGSMTYADAFDAADVWKASYALFNESAFGRREARQRHLRVGLGYRIGPFGLRFTAATYRERVVAFDPDFSDDIEDTFRYGALDAPGNAIALRYRRYVAGTDSVVPAYTAGMLPGGQEVYGLYAGPGAAGIDYDRRETDATVLRLENASTWRGHRLLVGVEQQQRATRAIAVPNGERLAFYAQSAELEVASYRDLSPSLARFPYYGYDYLGLRRADGERMVAFASGSDRDIAPLQITRADLYAADRFALGPLNADLGIRYGLFSHNRRVLADPYALVSLVRARDLPTVPRGIHPEYAVYFAGNEVVGFRSPEGMYFDALGHPAKGQQVAGAGRVRTAQTYAGRLDPEVFRDARTHAVLQPRVALNLAVAAGASVWLSYTRTAAFPSDEWLNATLLHYEHALTTRGALANADLKPETATTYTAGGTLAHHHLTVTLGVAQRDLADLALPQLRTDVFPNAYATFVSVGRARIRSSTLRLDVARTRGVALQAAYTLSQATGDLFDARSVTGFFWMREARPEGQGLLDETRHTIRGLLDYQSEAAAGPRLGRFHPFARLHVVLAAEAQSGDRYLTTGTPTALGQPFQPVGVSGWATRPWQVLVHLHAARDLTIRGRRLTIYGEVRNLLDRANVRRVYPATGRADDDGYLATLDGHAAYPMESTARFYYQTRLANPDFYGLPREIRLGLRLSL